MTAGSREQLLRAMSERELQSNIIKLAEGLGMLVGFTYNSRNSQTGEPDLRIVDRRNHRMLYWELKTQTGKVSVGRLNPKQNKWLPGQDEWLEALSECYTLQSGLYRPEHWYDGTIERILKGE